MKDFLFFTKGERNGLCLLVALAGASITISANLNRLIPPSSTDTTQFEKELELFKKSLQQKEERRDTYKVKEKLEETKPIYKKEEYRSVPKTEIPAKLSLEINSADTTDFKKLKGIGSAYANRIVKFREKLGGFYSVTQIKEVYGISEELFESIRPQLTVNQNKIKKIDLNDESFTYGFYHPYFPKKGVSTLVKARKEQGRIEKTEVKNILNLSDEDWKRLSPYLTNDK